MSAMYRSDPFRFMLYYFGFIPRMIVPCGPKRVGTWILYDTVI